MTNIFVNTYKNLKIHYCSPTTPLFILFSLMYRSQSDLLIGLCLYIIIEIPLDISLNIAISRPGTLPYGVSWLII